ncbi:hypothetical protein H8S23_01470 [Anaerofilum sp. BX8]|uniref:Uncharacterized protein n=1 Tax=Anaerofilum hominis TaxID=2763016 RepID=A0A923I8F5_9FIRM|nr:hypothetical protein [Anaerofilum hominis]MBC5580168.1 hypothetical protein [Anaerofilum hominis]
MSDWSKLYPADRRPGPGAISAQAATPLWDQLCGYLEQAYGVAPSVEYSR